VALTFHQPLPSPTQLPLLDVGFVKATKKWPISKSTNSMGVRGGTSNTAANSDEARPSTVGTARRSNRQPIGARQHKGRYTAAAGAGAASTASMQMKVQQGHGGTDRTVQGIGRPRQLLQARTQHRRSRRRRELQQQAHQQQATGSEAQQQVRRILLRQGQQEGPLEQQQQQQVTEATKPRHQHLRGAHDQGSRELSRPAVARTLQSRSRSTPYPQDAHVAAMQLPRFPFTRISDHAR
jgi:hypothetical protein